MVVYVVEMPGMLMGVMGPMDAIEEAVEAVVALLWLPLFANVDTGNRGAHFCVPHVPLLGLPVDGTLVVEMWAPVVEVVGIVTVPCDDGKLPESVVVVCK